MELGPATATAQPLATPLATMATAQATVNIQRTISYLVLTISIGSGSGNTVGDLGSGNPAGNGNSLLGDVSVSPTIVPSIGIDLFLTTVRLDPTISPSTNLE